MPESNLDRMRKAAANPPPKPDPKPQPVPKPPPPAPAGPSSSPPKPAKKKKQPKSRPTPIDRLPAGSEKRLTWDGELWHGTLTVPGVPEPFWFEAGNEKDTFHGLHHEYEKWKRENPPTPEPAPPGGPEPVVDSPATGG